MLIIQVQLKTFLKHTVTKKISQVYSKIKNLGIFKIQIKQSRKCNIAFNLLTRKTNQILTIK